MKTRNKVKLSFAILFMALAVSVVATQLSATVNAATPLTFSAIPNPATITYGQSTTYAVNITGSNGAPTGTVELYYQLEGTSTWNYSSSQTLSPDQIPDQSQVSFTFTPLAAGTYQFIAAYMGDSNFNAENSSSTQALTVNRAPSTISSYTVTPFFNSTGAFVTQSVSVAGVQGFAIPTDVVFFYVSTDGGNTWIQYDTEPLNSTAQATAIPYQLTVATTYEFNASYTCDSNYLEVNTTPVSLTWDGLLLIVNAPAASPTTIVAGASASSGGQTTLTAQATGELNQFNYHWLEEAPNTNSYFPTGTNSNTLTFTAPANQLGNYNFEVTVTDQLSGESQTSPPTTITATHGTASNVVISASAASITAGNQAAFTATAFDQFGNQWDVTAQTNWSINASAAGSWSSNGNVYTSENAGTWTVTGTYASTPYTTPLTVNPAALNHFVFNQISDQNAGESFTVTITAQDSYGNTVTSYTGVNSLSASTGSGTINPASTTAFTNGVWTSTVTITKAATTVTITTSNQGITGTSNAFTVSSSPTSTESPTASPTASPSSTNSPSRSPSPATTTSPDPGNTGNPTQNPTSPPAQSQISLWIILAIIVALIALTLGAIVIIKRPSK